jgi:predicted patatin/cPLA2 family phospholipase
MSTPLNYAQQRVARFYADGGFAHVKSVEEAHEAGDTLFTFCIVETADCDSEDMEEAVRRLSTARDQLRTLVNDIKE